MCLNSETQWTACLRWTYFHCAYTIKFGRPKLYPTNRGRLAMPLVPDPPSTGVYTTSDNDLRGSSHEILSYTKNFGRGKIWQTIQVKAIGGEKFGLHSQTAIFKPGTLAAACLISQFWRWAWLTLSSHLKEELVWATD